MFFSVQILGLILVCQPNPISAVHLLDRSQSVFEIYVVQLKILSHF